MRASISEDNGLAAIREQDQQVYSVGISTAGAAEIRMAIASPTRHVIATTLDREGAEFVQKQVERAGLLGRIEIKLEDVAAALPYPDEHFDFVYARLVLHYLPSASLKQALKELYRVLKTSGKIFVVVRSVDCFGAQSGDTIFDPQTGMTSYLSRDHSYRRHFHSPESIQNYLVASGFHIEHVKAYHEQLCVDFQRKKPSKQTDALIEVLANKPL